MATVTTAWGAATLVDEVSVSQEAGEKRFTAVVQLLADRSGEPYVRFAYRSGGGAARGPVTFRGEDVERLREALTAHEELATVLGMTSASAGTGPASESAA
ncbi:MAG: hypothetical protein ICV74_04300 [Thermoleophilia bacterium]|nr:hypothetical protein [Thermoleophilia bacterium]